MRAEIPMHLSRTVPIPFLRGKPMVSFGALTFKEAQHLTHEEWLRADLLHSRSNELPLSDGKAKLTVRLSTPEEKAALLVVIQENGGAAEHDLLLAYLVNLDSA